MGHGLEETVILSAHQPVYLPWLGLFSKIAQADLFCIFDIVQYGAKSWENRNFIKTQNGPLMLTVPVESNGHFGKTGGEIRIVKNGWARKHCRSIELAYAKAPYYKDYIERIEEILMHGHDLLSELNYDLLKFGLASFGITTPLVRASKFDFDGEKSALVLDMCVKLGATKYLFGAMGEDYADKEEFAAAGIELEFQDYQHPTYPQLHGEFYPRMAFIDLLFNEGPLAGSIIKGGNVLAAA